MKKQDGMVHVWKNKSRRYESNEGARCALTDNALKTTAITYQTRIKKCNAKHIICLWNSNHIVGNAAWSLFT